MSGAEFSLIDRYFAGPVQRRADVAVGIGDDAAVLNVPPEMQLVMAVDTLVADVHFPASASPASIGHKALAVNLSDLAAMGARPAWTLLALTLPAADAAWLEGFTEGFFALADRYDVALVGGDTTQGPLSVTVQAVGWIPKGQAVRRAGAQAGDRIYVTGTLGDAGLALQRLGDALADIDQLSRRLHKPEPRVRFGEQLRGRASAAIDVSDGLLADLGHILAGSGVGARLYVDRLPRSEAFRAAVAASEPAWFDLPLGAGDDYELCFTLPPEHVDALMAEASRFNTPMTYIGDILSTPGLQCLDEAGHEFRPLVSGFEHFRA